MIKFRVWDKLTQKYWNIENWHFEDEYLDLIEPGVSICDPRIERIWRKQGDVEIMQYTGLKDANGKEIYVGDIVEATIEGCIQDDKYLVKNMWDPHVWTEESDNYYAVSKMEVIGNVHENPELLKG